MRNLLQLVTLGMVVGVPSMAVAQDAPQGVPYAPAAEAPANNEAATTEAASVHASRYVRSDLRLNPHIFVSFDGGLLLGGSTNYSLGYTLENGTSGVIRSEDVTDEWDADLESGFVLSLSMTRVWSTWVEAGPRIQWGKMRDQLQADESMASDMFLRIDVPVRGYVPLGNTGLVLAAGGIFGINGRFPGEETYPMPAHNLRPVTTGETEIAGGIHGGPTVELRYYVNNHVGFRVGFDYLLHRMWGDIKPEENSGFIAYDDRMLTQRTTTAQLTFGVFTLAPR